MKRSNEIVPDWPLPSLILSTLPTTILKEPQCVQAGDQVVSDQSPSRKGYVNTPVVPPLQDLELVQFPESITCQQMVGVEEEQVIKLFR